MLIVALQFHSLDRAEAMRLARFIADIEPVRRDDVEFCFVARFDCEFDDDAMSYVQAKFPVSYFRTTTKWDGWPAGPNGIAKDVLTEAPKRWPDAFGVLLLEGDCVPTAKDWLKQIVGHWMLALLDNMWCMGSFRQSGPPCGHVNGSMVVRSDLARLVDLSVIGPDYAWDCAIAPQVMPHACISGLFLNKFRETGATEEILRTPETGGVPPVLVHGFKDTSALDIARKWLLP